MKKIIVAGGGHGGIGAASLLAEKGYDVTVYERHERDRMGYDWTDIFAPSAFQAVHMPMPAPSLYEYKENMTFYSPGAHTPLRQDIPADKLEIKMERSDIYAHIISHAEKNGVNICLELLNSKDHDDYMADSVQWGIDLVKGVGYYWFIWSLYQDSVGKPVGEWQYLWYKSTNLSFL